MITRGLGTSSLLTRGLGGKLITLIKFAVKGVSRVLMSIIGRSSV